MAGLSGWAEGSTMGRLQRMRDRGRRIVAGATAASMAAPVPLAPTAATASTKRPDPRLRAAPRPERPYTRVDVPNALRTQASGIDARGRIGGAYDNPNAPPSIERSRMPIPVPAIDDRNESS
jgi:hypothetical protein